MTDTTKCPTCGHASAVVNDQWDFDRGSLRRYPTGCVPAERLAEAEAYAAAWVEHVREFHPWVSGDDAPPAVKAMLERVQGLEREKGLIIDNLLATNVLLQNWIAVAPLLRRAVDSWHPAPYTRRARILLDKLMEGTDG